MPATRLEPHRGGALLHLASGRRQRDAVQGADHPVAEVVESHRHGAVLLHARPGVPGVERNVGGYLEPSGGDGAGQRDCLGDDRLRGLLPSVDEAPESDEEDEVGDGEPVFDELCGVSAEEFVSVHGGPWWGGDVMELRDAVQEGDDDESDDGEGGGGDHDVLLSPDCFRNMWARSRGASAIVKNPGTTGARTIGLALPPWL